MTRVKSRHKPLVLLADDSAIFTLKMIDVLGRAGYEVITVSTGAAALRQARARHPDLIIMDVEMPEMTGLEACGELKNDPSTARIPIVLMTAHDDPRHLRDGFRSGCDGYLTKGMSEGEVVRKLSLKLMPGTSMQGR